MRRIVGAGRTNASPDSAACAFPECEATPSKVLDLPLCDRHIAKVWRAVEAEMRSRSGE